MAETNPYRAYQFKLEIGGVAVGYFTECSALEIDSNPFREARNHQFEHHIPGPADYTPVTLKRGVINSRELWDLLMKTVEGEVQPLNISIVLLDSIGGGEVMKWNLVDAWPSALQVIDLNASDKGMAFESLTLVYNRLERA